MDVDAQDEELADLHVDLAAGEVDAAGGSDLGRDVLGCGDGGVDKGLVEGGLWEVVLAFVSAQHAARNICIPLCSAPKRG